MIGRAEKIWLLLAGLTLLGAWLAETAEHGWLLAVTVAGVIVLKGRLVAVGYMEIGAARALIRRAVWGFVLAVPFLALLDYRFGDVVAQYTRAALH
ncbi:MAG TPA: cytochrome C oxidase subunit IV family protein [Rhodocyclaceae bacterium]